MLDIYYQASRNECTAHSYYKCNHMQLFRIWFRPTIFKVNFVYIIRNNTIPKVGVCIWERLKWARLFRRNTYMMLVLLVLRKRSSAINILRVVTNRIYEYARNQTMADKIVSATAMWCVRLCEWCQYRRSCSMPCMMMIWVVLVYASVWPIQEFTYRSLEYTCAHNWLPSTKRG